MRTAIMKTLLPFLLAFGTVCFGIHCVGETPATPVPITPLPLASSDASVVDAAKPVDAARLDVASPVLDSAPVPDANRTYAFALDFDLPAQPVPPANWTLVGPPEYWTVVSDPAAPSAPSVLQMLVGPGAAITMGYLKHAIPPSFQTSVSCDFMIWTTASPAGTGALIEISDPAATTLTSVAFSPSTGSLGLYSSEGNNTEPTSLTVKPGMWTAIGFDLDVIARQATIRSGVLNATRAMPVFSTPLEVRLGYKYRSADPANTYAVRFDSLRCIAR
jgi:hypothetical protein